MTPYRAPTRGARLAVWCFPALTLWLGLGYLRGGPQRFQSGAFDAAQQVWSMHTWGVVFMVVALVKIGCLLTDRPRSYVVAMCIGMGLYAWWAFLFTASFVLDDRTSPGAPAWPVFVVAMHVAILLTLHDSGAAKKTRR